MFWVKRCDPPGMYLYTEFIRLSKLFWASCTALNQWVGVRLTPAFCLFLIVIDRSYNFDAVCQPTQTTCLFHPMPPCYALIVTGRWESNINVWFPFMYSPNRIIMFCLPVPTLILYICEIFIYFQAYSGKYVNQSWEYINRSQTHECGWILGLRAAQFPEKGYINWIFLAVWRISEKVVTLTLFLTMPPCGFTR